jgi:hypothetical protein
MFAFCNVTTVTGEYIENAFVRILELTHERSAVPRAKVLYQTPNKDYEFYRPRAALVSPIQLRSQVKFCMSWQGFEYWIEARADFFKHPNHKWVDVLTPYLITNLRLGLSSKNGTETNIQNIHEFSGIPIDQIKTELHSQLLNFVDDLPF